MFLNRFYRNSNVKMILDPQKAVRIVGFLANYYIQYKVGIIQKISDELKESQCTRERGDDGGLQTKREAGCGNRVL